MEIKKTKSIFNLFLGYLASLVVSVILLIVAAVVMLSLALTYEILLPANFVETELSKVENILSENFNENLLPLHSSYVIIDLNLGVHNSNMSNEELLKTQNYLLDGTKTYYDRYKKISLANGNILVVQYKVLAHFRNPLIHQIIPYPELALLILILTFIVLFSVLTAWRFSKKLKINLFPIIEASEKISEQDLEFPIKKTKIKEFNDALTAIDKLKTELKLSLQKQWEDEQHKKSALSALAHDLKTPLTVIKGNSELLLEEDLNNDAKETVFYIKQGSITIERYIEILMTVVNDNSFNVNKETVSIQYFVDDLKFAILSLCKTKTITLNLQNKTLTNIILIDRELMQRALLNVMDNAVRFSDRNSTIDFIITEDNACFLFNILDSGNGFSAESLKKGVLEFYTEDISRSDKHYGLGLSVAKKVAELHNGSIEISNTHKGAKVSIKVPKIS